MDTIEVAEKCKVSKWTVIKWCKKQKGIKRKIGVNGISEYDLTEKDIEKFKSRNKNLGRPKKEK
jgi:hypothetical protein